MTVPKSRETSTVIYAARQGMRAVYIRICSKTGDEGMQQ